MVLNLAKKSAMPREYHKQKHNSAQVLSFPTDEPAGSD